MPKVVGVDNHNRDCQTEHLLAENLTLEEAQKLATETNRKNNIGDGEGHYYVVKPDNYTPYVFNGY